MQIIKKMKPANRVGKDSMLHILGGTNLNAKNPCRCNGGSIDNLNVSVGCECYS